MKYIKFLFKKNLLFIISLLSITSVAVFAAPPSTPYNANETLDPSCAPGDTNCIVQISAGSDNLGNHTMTGNLLTNGYWVSNDGGNEGIFVTSTGSVGIQNSAPFQSLTISGNVAGFNYYIYDQAATNAGTTGFGNGNGPGIEYWGNSASQTGALIFKTNTNERMRIDSTGNIGIGTSTPGVKLDVLGGSIRQYKTDGSDATFIARTTTGNVGQLRLQNDAGRDYAIRSWSASGSNSEFSIDDVTAGARRLTIGATGNIGIGMAAPTDKLQVQFGDIGLNDAYSLKWGNSNIYGYNGTGGYINFKVNNGQSLYLADGGNVGIGTISPQALLHVDANSPSEKGVFINNSNASGYAALRIGSSDRLTNGDALFYNSPTSVGIITPTGRPLTFEVGGGEKMKIDSTGNIGIGIAPVGTAKLSLNGALRFTSNSTASDIYTGMGAVGTDTVGIATAGTERMRIDSAGSVGIGTSAPVGKLEVQSPADSRGIIVSSTSGNSPFYETYAGGASANQKIWRWGSLANGYFIVQSINDAYNNAIDRFVLSPTGEATIHSGIVYVGNATGTGVDNRIEIGASTTVNHNSYIDLVGDTTYTDYGLRIIRGAGANNTSGIYQKGTGPLDIVTQDAAAIRFYTNNLQRVQINTTGTLTFNAYGAGTLTTDVSGNVTASSDERLKDVKGKFVRGLSDIIKISPITYKWNKTSGLDQTQEYSGFSAQNMQEAIPEAVGKDSRGYLSLSDRPVLATLVNAVKELYAQLTSNDEDIATLKKVIELQQKQIDYLMSQSK